MVMFRSVAPLALSILVSTCGLGCVDISAGESRFVDTVEKRFAVSSAPSLRLGTFDGSVLVETWDRPEVLVVVERHAFDKEAADRMLVTAVQSGDQIHVDVREDKDGRMHMHFGSHYARLVVTVPKQARVEANTGDGRVTIRSVAGDLRVHTGDGSIHLEGVDGAVDATSGDGNIDIDGTIRQLTARSGDGRMRIHTLAAGPTSDWSIATGDGSVVLEVPENFGAELDASTGDGRVVVSGVAFSGDRGRRERGPARGRLGNGGPRISIHSGDGSISVRSTDSSVQP